MICAATLLACTDGAGPVGPSPSTSLLPELETEYLPGIPVLDPFADPLIDQGVVESARGGGHLTFMDARRTFAFTANNKADGTTQGEFQINNRAEGFFKEHGVVTCLFVEDNQAWVGGVVLHSDGGTEGISRVWRVVDNGEGSNDPPDMISLAATFGPAGTEQVCKTPVGLVLPLMPIEDGNIQVTDDGASPI
jgi:hypothetical protein